MVVDSRLHNEGGLQLVGDRHALTDRQRLAVARASGSDQAKNIAPRQICMLRLWRVIGIVD